MIILRDRFGDSSAIRFSDGRRARNEDFSLTVVCHFRVLDGIERVLYGGPAIRSFYYKTNGH